MKVELAVDGVASKVSWSTSNNHVLNKGRRTIKYMTIYQV